MMRMNPQNTFSGRRPSGERNVCLVLLAFFLTVGSFVALSGTADAQPAYSCNGHCYAGIDWPNPVNGAETNISIVFITCGNCGGFVTNEMWVIGNYGNHACPIPNTPNVYLCWIEAGYSTWGVPNAHFSNSCIGPNGIANCYFWADNRPNGGYHEHPTANITQYGVYADFTIERNSTSSPTWDVYVNGGHYQSTSNNFPVSDIQIGEELYGTGGANSPYTLWTYNRWRSTRDNSWNFQGNSGSPIGPYNPPYGGWLHPPAGSSNGGGTFWACTTSNC